MTSEPRTKSKLREFFSLGEVGGYFFRKKDPNQPVSFNLKMMHGVNKISIIVFLAAVMVLVFRRLMD